jgi:hypothetical protein
MAVRRGRLAGSVSDLHYRGLQMSPIQIGKCVGKSDTSLFVRVV